MLPRQRPVVAPHGIAASVAFFAHNPGEPYAHAAKIKTLDAHPVHPWLVTADEHGIVVIWDYAAESVLMRFSVDGVKEGQRAAVETLELHAALAASQGVAVPDVAGPGLGTGPISAVGAAIGPGTEGFVSSLASGAVRRRGAASAADDSRSGKTGGVRTVRFADEHCLALYTGSGRGDYSDYDPCGRIRGDRASAEGGSPPLAASLGELAAMLSYAGDANDSSSSGGGGNTGPLQPSWIVVACEHRAMLVDYVTRAAVDFPYSALLLESTGGGGRTLTKGRPSVHSVTLVGPSLAAFGCEDGAIRLWSGTANAVVQTLRTSGASGRPITHLYTLATAPHAVSGTLSQHSAGTAGVVGTRGSRVLLLSGCVDGTISVWDVLPGSRQAAPVPTHTLRLGCELVELSLCRHTLHVIALGADKSVLLWDAASPPAATAGGPRITASGRLGTSSSSAETGLGSRLTSGVSLGGHPWFPPHAVIVAGKGPHLEIALLSTGGISSSAGTDAGTTFLDLRGSRPGLPSKLKIYTLSGHPFKPDVLVAGTNIGVFVVLLAPAYSTGALAVSHCAWGIPAHVVASATPASTSEQQRAQREGRIIVHVSAAGQLVALEATVTTPHSAEDVLDTLSSRDGDADDPIPAVELGVTVHVLAPSIAPFNPPPPTRPPATGSGGAGAAAPSGPLHNAVAAMSAQLKGGSGILPGARGVRLRVSGSGRYVAAVWPDYKCFAVFRLTFGPLGAGDPHDRSEWNAEYVDGGQGLDVAWSGCGVSYNDTFSGSISGARASSSSSSSAAVAGAVSGEEDYEEEDGDREEDDAGDVPSAVASASTRAAAHLQRQMSSSSSASSSSTASTTGRRSLPPAAAPADRYAVIEPGAPITGRGPMGGGMSIGSSVTKSAGAKGARGGGTAGTPLGGTGVIPNAPSKLVIRELPVDGGAAWVGPEDAARRVATAPTPVTLIASLVLPNEPVGVWGGPILGISTVADSAAAASPTPLAGATLQWFAWDLVDPPLRSAEEVAKEAAMAARYSGLGGGGAGSAKAPEARLRQLSSFASCPSPSAASAESNCGVLWNGDGSRVAVCSPTAVHVFAPARMESSSSSSSSSSGSTAGYCLVEVCCVTLQAVNAVWFDGVLLVTGSGGRLHALFTPLVLAEYVGVITSDTSPASAASTAACALRSELGPLCIELSSIAPGPALTLGALPEGTSTCITPTPPTRRGLVNPHTGTPICIARGHVLTAHWSMLPPGGVSYASSGVALSVVPVTHPALRAYASLGSRTQVEVGARSRGSSEALISGGEAAAEWATLAQRRQRSYARVCVEAARWASLLPLSAQTDVGISLSRLGAVSAALLLPGIDPRSAVALSLTLLLPAVLRGGALEGAPAIDVGVALAWLCRFCAAADGDMLEEMGEGGPVSVWPQIAAFMSMAAVTGAAGGVDDGMVPRVSSALHTLVLRLSEHGLLEAAEVVAAVAGACALAPPSSAGSSSSSAGEDGGDFNASMAHASQALLMQLIRG